MFTEIVHILRDEWGKMSPTERKNYTSVDDRLSQLGDVIESSSATLAKRKKQLKQNMKRNLSYCFSIQLMCSAIC